MNSTTATSSGASTTASSTARLHALAAQLRLGEARGRLAGWCPFRHGCQMAIASICLALRASGLWLRYATLQNLIRFLSLDCARVEGVGAIWQHCSSFLPFYPATFGRTSHALFCDRNGVRCLRFNRVGYFSAFRFSFPDWRPSLDLPDDHLS